MQSFGVTKVIQGENDTSSELAFEPVTPRGVSLRVERTLIFEYFFDFLAFCDFDFDCGLLTFCRKQSTVVCSNHAPLFLLYPVQIIILSVGPSSSLA